MASVLMKILLEDLTFLDVLNHETEVHLYSGREARKWGGVPFYGHMALRVVGEPKSWHVIFCSRRVRR